VQRNGRHPSLFAIAASVTLLATPATSSLAADSPAVTTPAASLEPGTAGTPSSASASPPPAAASPGPEPSFAADARRPDIVMFYLDDFSPRPRTLWEDPHLTPHLATFASRGVRFSDAIVSTPLCGPSRAGLLTGRYSHSTGVIGNDIAPYRPVGEVGEKLGKTGYRTVFVGKHVNRLADTYRTREQMDQLAAGWDEFDVMWEDQGKFYDWTQYRKEGTYSYGEAPGDHSSRVAAERAVDHIVETPVDQPLFMIISLADGHVPLTPMRRFRNDSDCEALGAWRSPSFDEADVSDKPAFIQALPMLGTDGYDLGPRCKQLKTVDWVVGKVQRALRQAGRFDDTLEVLTADNGWLMGDHRIVGKSYPYAVDVPLYVRWPDGTGDRKRVVEEPVTNLDWLPTFCELAGCGAPHTDGLSLVPLITGERDRLDRQFLFFELLYDNPRYPDDPRARPAYTGVESTLAYSDTRWSFTHYSDGEAELYDLTHDPYRLDNLHGLAAFHAVERDLQRFHKSVKQADGVTWQADPVGRD
jgi:N-acetylglucosamine-6-sulfatase